MVIISTEKRFDWKHAPVVLFFLGVNQYTNFLQSADEEEIGEALDSYIELGYLDFEWSIFKIF